MNLVLSFLLFFLSAADVFAGAHLYDMTNSRNAYLRKWKTPHVKWRYTSSGAPANAEAIIKAAFKVWESQTQATISNSFEGTTSGTDPKLDGYSDFFFNIDFASRNLDSNIVAITLLNSTDANTLSSASAARITEADFLINPALLGQAYLDSENAPNDPSTLDLVEVLAHEIGHAYGMAHSFLIDSLMFPAKPAETQTEEFKALFRGSKRILAQDDISWLNYLYPSSDIGESTGTIEGSVSYKNKEYVGAHVVAIKMGASDLDFKAYPPSSQSTTLVKGLANVSTFSDEDGDFKIPAVPPGDYKILVQNSNSFMNLYGLNRVNAVLAISASTSTYPLQVWSNPDCSSNTSLSFSDLNSALEAATSFSVVADKGYCDVEILAHIAGEASCGSSAKQKGSCSGGGGCSLNELADPTEHTGLWMIIFGSVVFIFICARIRRKSKFRANSFRRSSNKPWI